MQVVLAREGQLVWRKPIRQLMRKMGLLAVGLRCNTSRPHQALGWQTPD